MLLVTFSGLSQAQESTVETDFNRDIKKFTREKFVVGEDASSGSDYLIYKNKTQIVKMRIIWSGCCRPPEVTDIYFENGAPVLYAELLLTKKQFKSYVNGSNLPLKATKKLYFKNSKLVTWIENGKIMPATDPKWAQAEKDAFERAKSELETYPTLKDN